MTTSTNTDTQEFINAFNGDSDTASKPEPALGIDPRQADSEAMASAFNAADVTVGAPMPTSEIEGSSQPLPPVSPEPAEAVKPVAAAATPALDAADVAAGGSRPEQAVKADALPTMTDAAESKPVAEVSKPEFKTFGQAFKWHRQQAANGGPKVFEWNGKKFTTQLKTEAAATRPTSSAGTRNTGSAASKTTPASANRAPAATPVATQFKSGQAPAAVPDKPLHVRQQEAYDEWQRQLSESKTWWGGQDTMRPFQKERLQEAERKFEKLLSATK